MNKKNRLILLLSPFTIYSFLFFLGPMLILLFFSFLEPGIYGWVEWNFYHHNYGRILGWANGEYEEFDLVYGIIFFRSLRLALITVFFTLLICYPAALWISNLSKKLRNFFIFLITLPFFASLVVRLFAWMILLKPSGILNQFLIKINLIHEPLQMLFTEGAVIVGMVYIFIPFMFLPLYASIEKIDPKLIEASKDLGANKFITFYKVTLPLSLPGIIGGSILVFIPSLGNFIVPDLLGGAKVVMIGNLIEQSFINGRNWPFGSALSMILMTTVIVFLLFYVRSISKYDNQTEVIK
jgi:spermidine/putrescine transport system permease protein